MFFMLKAFGAGVILATGFIHMWPDANESFSNSCLGEQCAHPSTVLVPAQSAEKVLDGPVCLQRADDFFWRLSKGVLPGQKCPCHLGGLH